MHEKYIESYKTKNRKVNLVRSSIWEKIAREQVVRDCAVLALLPQYNKRVRYVIRVRFREITSSSMNDVE